MKQKQFLSFLKYVWGYLDNKRRIVLCILCCAIADAVLGLWIPLITMHFIDVALPNRNFAICVIMLALIFLVPVSKGLLLVVEDYFANYLGHIMMKNIRSDIFRQLLSTQYGKLIDTDMSKNVKYIIEDPEEVAHWIYIVAIRVILNGTQLIGTLGCLSYLYWKFGIIAIMVVIIYIFPFKYCKKKLEILSERITELSAQSFSIFNESRNAFIQTKVFALEKYFDKKYQNANSNYKNALLGFRKLDNASRLMIGILVAGAACSIYFLGANEILAGKLTLGTLIASQMYIEQLLMTSQDFFERLQQTIAKFPIAAKLEQLGKDTTNLEVQGTKTINKIDSVSFQNVSFKHRNSAILQNFSFSFNRGEFVALVGPSGCGKTTMMNLLIRLYDPEAGEIKINNNPSCLYTLEALRNSIVMVPQTADIITGTIFENIVFGLDVVDSEEIMQFATLLGVDAFVSKLPNGYKTVIGRNSNTILSGGQIQRLALLRAILQHPQVLLLDEVTASLDQENKKLMLSYIKQFKSESLVIWATHDPDVAERADKVLFLSADGKSIFNTHMHLWDSMPEYRTHFKKDGQLI